MTETQAKSGEAGASAEAGEPAASAAAATATGAQEASGAPASEPVGGRLSSAETDSGTGQGGVSHGGAGFGAGTSDGGSSAVKATSFVPVIAVPAAAVSPPVGSASATAAASANPGASSNAGTGVVARASVPAAQNLHPAPHPVPGGGASALRSATGAHTAIGGAAARPVGASAIGAARVSEVVRSARATVAGAATRGPRRARLHLKRIDPWSVMKFAFAVSLVLFVVAIVATSVLYLALDAMSVFDSINEAFSEMTGQAGGTDSFKITAKGVIGTAVLLGAVNMVLFTALMTLGAFVYNVCADLVGGVELTLSEKD